MVDTDLSISIFGKKIKIYAIYKHRHMLFWGALYILLLQVPRSSFKTICISPGGLLGFYLWGTCSFIKDQYDLTEYRFVGASAGAWNALLMTYNKDDHVSLTLDILNGMDGKQNIHNIESSIQETLRGRDADFDLSRLNIGLTVIDHCIPRWKTVDTFTDLADALDCCIGSSHIPWITGGWKKTYKNQSVLDGGLRYHAFVKKTNPVLHITPTMWNANRDVSFLDTLCVSKTGNPGKTKKTKDAFFDLYLRGYQDALKNRATLDSIFKPNRNHDLKSNHV